MRRPRASWPTLLARPTRHARPRPNTTRCWPLSSVRVRVAATAVVGLLLLFAYTRRPLDYSDDSTSSDAIPSRAFPLWKDTGRPVPCIIDRPPDDGTSLQSWTPINEADQRQPSREGFLFVKIDKAGSSTMAGVALRIAHALGKRQALEGGEEAGATALPENQQVCRARVSHAWSKQSDFDYSSRDKDKSFLFTMLRDPKSRAVSEFHWQVGMTGVQSSDDSLLHHLRSVRNFQLGLVVDSTDRSRTTETNDIGEIPQLVSNVLVEFDFIGLLERLDESLVALQFVLGLKTRDIVHTKSKQSGSYVLVKSRANSFKGECNFIPKKASVSPGVETYLGGREWDTNNRGDNLLYDAANRSLDRTIDAIGRSSFDRALARYRVAQAMADTKCQPISPCTEDGRVRAKEEAVSPCYLWDLGCNHVCLDRLDDV